MGGNEVDGSCCGVGELLDLLAEDITLLHA